jgi:Domain of unknown function (DUF6766)
MRKILRDNSLSLVMFSLFGLCLLGHSLAGYAAYCDDQQAHRQPSLRYTAYVMSSHFWASVFENWVVLDNSNVEKLASNPYLLVHALPQEDHNDTDDASSGYVYPILMPESTVQAVQSSRRRPYRASVVDRETQAHRTAALYRLHPGVLRASGHVDGPEQVA